MSNHCFTAFIDYDDLYVQPIVVEALKRQLPESSYELCPSLSNPSNSHSLYIQSYETLDFEQALEKPESLINAYIIRKALIRKHYLSDMIFSWVTKHPNSVLQQHTKISQPFELDYAEFLDDALVEAFELRATLDSNATLDMEDRAWWILKPGMSDRGQGIRLFSTLEELTAIFEGWEAEYPDDDSETDDLVEDNNREPSALVASIPDDAPRQENHEDDNDTSTDEFIITSHLRHFIAQPYIEQPLLLSAAPYNSRKFHIRTYVVAAGALRVYVYANMLALFASEPYSPPWATKSGDEDTDLMDQDLLQKMRNVHLTNTCVQKNTHKSTSQNTSPDFSDENVFLLSKLPLPEQDLDSIKAQICSVTSELFQAAVAQPTYFQPLPQAFEVFGVDFLVDAENNVWLLEVNAFPDFAQTGEELRDVVVRGLWEEVMKVVVGPYFGATDESARSGTERLIKVLDQDLGRR